MGSQHILDKKYRMNPWVHNTYFTINTGWTHGLTTHTSQEIRDGPMGSQHILDKKYRMDPLAHNTNLTRNTGWTHGLTTHT